MATINNGYINLAIPSDRDTLIQSALSSIATTLPGWRPREGNLEVLLLEQFADMAAESASVAAQVPLSIFSYYGSMLGLGQNMGTQMVVTTTWTLAVPSTNDTLFAAGTKASAFVNSTYYQFELVNDLVVSAGDRSASGTMIATNSGSSYNAVYSSSGTTYLQALYNVANLSSILVTGVTVSGVDSENDTNYFNRLSNSLTLYTPRPIIPNDFSALATEVSGVGRASAYNNVNASINQLASSAAFPSTTSWLKAGGSTITASGNPAGIKVTMPTGISSFTAGTAVPGQSIIPMISTTTASGATVVAGTTTTMALVSGTSWASGSGVGFVYGTDAKVHAFTYNSRSTNTLSTVTFFESFTYASGAVASYGGTWGAAGVGGFWDGFVYGTKAINDTNIAGMAVRITQSAITETVVIHKVIAYGSTIAFDALTFVNTYAASALTVELCPGTTTDFLPIQSNGVNLVGMVQTIAPSGSLSLSAATFSTGIYTYTGTAVSSTLAVGDIVNVTGFTNSAFNLTNAVVATAGSTTFTVALAGSPGTTTGTGTATLVTYDSSVPVLTAVVQYDNDAETHTYSSDVTLGYEYSNIPECIAVLMQGTDPTQFRSASSYVSSVLTPNPTPVDTNASVQNFSTNINSIKLGVYWTRASASQRKYLLFASAYEYAGNFSYVAGNSWKQAFNATGQFGASDGAPGNILPDAKFKSVFSNQASTAYTGSTATITSLSGGIAITSTAYWPTSGVGSILGNSLSSGAGSPSSHYFSYTGITYGSGSAGTLTGVSILGSSSDYIISGSMVTCLIPANIPQQWFYSGTSHGTLYPLDGLGIQFLPLESTLTGNTTVKSSIFSLPYAQNGQYVLDVTIDASAVTTSTHTPTVSVVSAVTNAVITSGSSTATATGIYGTKTRLNQAFSISSDTDVYVLITFPSGMSTASSQSTTVTQINLLPLAGTLTGVTESYGYNIDAKTGPSTPGPYWTPGGVLTTGQERNITVSVTDDNGLAPNWVIIENVRNYLEGLREINFDVNVVGPNYVPISVYYSVASATNYDETTIKNSILTSLLTSLSPYRWGGGSMNPPIWDAEQTTIRYLNLAGLVDDVVGVASVLDLQIGIYGSALARSDITMGGLASLPILVQITGQVVRSSSSIYEVSGS